MPYFFQSIKKKFVYDQLLISKQPLLCGPKIRQEKGIFVFKVGVMDKNHQILFTLKYIEGNNHD